ncbi:MAG: tRNA threonylcarbamoyladenosine dehydratase [Oscillospiraceae bacterium]|jgi:tRNA A37 threonylcarbamoyladenosine dehydratase|nr:tRNA threonylcarbamoyladenosine dehydratase [Oscillospiraceae bacterium]
MSDMFSRTRMLVGDDGIKRLKNAAVAVFGIGGVGSYVVEALARCGVGRFLLVDKDRVCASNINRQIIATNKTIGRLKVEVMRERILDINPGAAIEISPIFYNNQTADDFDLSNYSYVVDAIDTVKSKLTLIERAKALNVPIISSMGAGNRLDPGCFEVTDIYQTSYCPLAKIMRRELRRRGIENLKVVYSKEIIPIKNIDDDVQNTGKRQVGSISFVPSVAGLMIAGELVRDIINGEMRASRSTKC